ncbi:chemosensory receptor A [Elysia marginata]|uniref:Chemosensory receptor A n=1 Tax=Elysia marginata TaxID=1093978 RepID=A0AAV4JGT5_9GAST|nr:chemosensory receptor A [Elysia marginata]
MPLKFKVVFTRSRTIKWVLFLVVATVLLHFPVLSIYKVEWKKDSVTNVSYPYVVGKKRAEMSRINDVMNRGFIIWINYIVMVTCVCILSRRLYQASKMRSHFTATKWPQNSDQSPDRTTSRGLLSRDLHVIKSVVMVCVIFILSQLPYMALSLNRLLDSEFNIIDSRLLNLFGIVSNVARTCSLLNASINIFVYYNCNSKYRSVFLTLVASRKNDTIETNKL